MEKARTGRGIGWRMLAVAEWLMSGWEGVVLCIVPYGEPSLERLLLQVAPALVVLVFAGVWTRPPKR